MCATYMLAQDSEAAGTFGVATYIQLPYLTLHCQLLKLYTSTAETDHFGNSLQICLLTSLFTAHVRHLFSPQACHMTVCPC